MKIGIAQRPARGEITSGDVILVIDGPPVMIVVADGLGHGPSAAEAAQAFCRFVEGRPGQSPEQILRAASTEFDHSRGLAVALVAINVDTSTLAFCGVGNVELRAKAEATIRPISMPGIVGRPIRKILAFNYVLAAGDILIAYTDGISGRFDIEEFADLDADAMATAILEKHGKWHDDASCAVILV